MIFKIERRSIVSTSIEIHDSMIDKIINDLRDHDYLDEIGEFDTMDELMAIFNDDQTYASLIFEVIINSPGYPKPNENFGEEEFDMFTTEN